MSRFSDSHDGTDGVPGPTGPTGPKGDKGDTGSTGAQGPKGDAGSVASSYYGSFFDEVDQTGTTNSIQAMCFRTTDFANGISINGSNKTQIAIANAGKYNIAFSAQLHQTNSSGIINIWLAKNGTAVENSNTKVAITANNPYYVAAWNFFVDAEANDYYEIMWSSTSSNTVIEYEAAVGSGATLHPAIPSIILTVNQIG
jgi:hypothetical protein